MTRIRVTQPGKLLIDVEISCLLNHLWLALGKGPRLPYTIEVTVMDGEAPSRSDLHYHPGSTCPEPVSTSDGLGADCPGHYIYLPGNYTEITQVENEPEELEGLNI